MADERPRHGGGRRSRWHAEKKQQLAKRLTPEFVRQTLGSFHRGSLDASGACELLGVSRAHLFRIRLAWLHDAPGFALRVSGGDHHESWPPEIRAFLGAFLPLQRPPNFQLVADQLAERFSFHRDRKSVAAYARAHFPNLVLPPLPVPKPKRRWERSRIGELWQHDSSIHPWWAADEKQTLLLTVDDHSRKYLGATFVVTGHFKTSHSGSLQNQPVRGGVVHRVFCTLIKESRSVREAKRAGGRCFELQLAAPAVAGDTLATGDFPGRSNGESFTR